MQIICYLLPQQDLPAVQLGPVHPPGQRQVKLPGLSIQVPPFLQGAYNKHSFTSISRKHNKIMTIFKVIQKTFTIKKLLVHDCNQSLSSESAKCFLVFAIPLQLSCYK